MIEQRQTLPKWILIVSGLFALMELGVGISMLVSPASLAESVDLTAKGVEFLIYMWATRQLALGCIFAFATLKKSVPMLTVTYIFLLVMMIGDGIIGIIQQQHAMIYGAVVMSAISAGILYVLSKKK